MIFKNSNCDETQKPKLWWNLKTQKVMKLKNSNCDEIQKLIVIKLKNSNCDKTWKLKLWWNAKTQIAIKLNNSKCDHIQIVTKLKNSNCDKATLTMGQNLNYDKLKGLLIGTFWHLDNRYNVLWAAFCNSRDNYYMIPYFLLIFSFNIFFQSWN